MRTGTEATLKAGADPGIIGGWVRVRGLGSPKRQVRCNSLTRFHKEAIWTVMHTSLATTAVKGIIGMYRFNICLVVVVVLSLSFSGVKTQLEVISRIG